MLHQQQTAVNQKPLTPEQTQAQMDAKTLALIEQYETMQSWLNLDCYAPKSQPKTNH